MIRDSQSLACHSLAQHFLANERAVFGQHRLITA